MNLLFDLKYRTNIYQCPDCKSREMCFSMPFSWNSIIVISSIKRMKAKLYKKEIEYSDVLWDCKNCNNSGKTIIC